MKSPIANLALIAALILTGPLQAATEKFDFEVLQYRAKVRATQPFVPPDRPLPDWLRKLDYDQYRDIRFDPMQSWWRDAKLPFQLQFFHLGGIFHEPVQLHEVIAGKEQRIDFSPRLFDYGHNRISGHVPADLGYAGLRIHYPLNRPEYYDELAVFLGASYFRALGQDQRYGLSARGLALNTGEPGGEEFPIFEEFWLEKPAPGARSLTLYALLDSRNVTGAYRFIITPGKDTVMQIKAAVYCRQNPKVFGIAPLTSMFTHGENTNWSRDDYRPEVHDSDGLLIANGAGEWIWRPLSNPGQIRHASFLDNAPRGFGLVQRDRDFKHYDDLEAFYHQRPSAWVEPVGNWGPGQVRLVELPTPNEMNDNIVAFWVPAQLPPAGEPITFEYKLHWSLDMEGRPPAGYVASTRSATIIGRPDLRRFVIEYEGRYLNQEPAGAAIAADVSIGAGARLEGTPVVQKNQFTGGWRVAFAVHPDGSGHPVEMRCYLHKERHVLTEIWSNLWTP